MTGYDLLLALPFSDLLVFLWFFVILDVPRYLLASIVAPWLSGGHTVHAEVTGIIPCHNEQHTVRRCIGKGG